MRKILVDTISEGSMLVSPPLGEQRTMKIAEPAAGNVGKTGLAGIGRNIYSRQNLEITLERSGNLSGVYNDIGAGFYMRPDFLRDADGNDIVDARQYMGQVYQQNVFYPQVIESQIDYALQAPCVCRLEHWTGAEANAGNIALLGYLRQTGVATWDIVVKVLKAEPEGYAWEDSWSSVGALTGVTANPWMDMVELPDGTVVLCALEDGTLHTYRSFDGGANFKSISTTTGISVGGHSTTRCTLDRIGSRLVLVNSGYDGAANREMYSHVSNDAGQNWDTNYLISSIAAGSATRDVKLVRGTDGYVYLFNLYLTAYVNRSRDGVNWESAGSGLGVAVTGNGTYNIAAYQSREGSWFCFNDDTGPYRVYVQERNDVDAYGAFGSGTQVLPSIDDAQGMTSYTGMDIASIFDDSFSELVVAKEFSDVDSYWTITAFRLAMWCSRNFLDTSEPAIIWYADHYPSLSDPEPYSDVWALTDTAATNAVLDTTEKGFLHFEVANAETFYYTITNAANGYPFGDAYDYGFAIVVECRVVSGTFHVRFLVNDTSGGGTDEVEITVQISAAGIQIYDANAGGGAGAIISSETPTNWDPTTWNTYIITMMGNQMRVWRAPGEYREILPFEFAEEGDDEFTVALSGAAASQKVEWGHMFDLAAGDSEFDVRMFAYYSGVAGNVGSLDAVAQPRRAHYNPVGLLQGISSKFGGEYAVEDDAWELDVGEVYAPENVFVSSPSRMWKEPEQSGGVDSPARVFDIVRGQDSFAEDLSMPAYGVALIGRNFLDFKVEGADSAGASWDTLFDSTASDIAYKATFTVKAAGVDANRLLVWPETSNPSSFAPMIPNQYASDDRRNWYIKFTDGSAINHVYKVVANDADYLYFDVNVEQDGVAAADTFVLFSSNFFFEFATKHFYPRLRLTIPSQSRYIDELSLQLRTLAYGRIIDLDDDEWGSIVGLEPNSNVVGGKSGRRIVSKLGPARRVVSLNYSGQTDKGMGSTGPSELVRLVGGGLYPLVWIDHDDELGAHNGHHDPILCKILGGVRSQHQAYRYFDESEGVGFGAGYVIHNVFDVGPIVLEEEL